VESPITIIDTSFPQTLSRLAKGVTNELLVASPWITTVAARIVSVSLEASNPIALQIIARLDEADFLSGASHLDAFRPETYPRFANVRFRALPLLHAKMLIADRRKVLIGSANMTEGGLSRNHEISVLIDSEAVGKMCADAFFRLWEIATDPEPEFIRNIENLIQDSLPVGEESPIKDLQQRKSAKAPLRKMHYKYVKPRGAISAVRYLSELLSTPISPENDIDDYDTALAWLKRGLHHLPYEERNRPENLLRLERLIYHPDVSIRATAVDRAGRSGNILFVRRLLTNPAVNSVVRYISFSFI
jgi:hypothetical protein